MATETKQCVYCAEAINTDAIICRHCQRPLPDRALKITHTENALGLGVTSTSYAIWDLSRGGAPVSEFPRDPNGWESAWQQWQTLHGRARSSERDGVDASTVWGGVAPSGTNGKAVAALILAIVWIGGIGAVIAVFLGHAARREIDASGGAQQGRGMATAGIVLGWLGIGALLLGIIASAAEASDLIA